MICLEEVNLFEFWYLKYQGKYNSIGSMAQEYFNEENKVVVFPLSQNFGLGRTACCIERYERQWAKSSGFLRAKNKIKVESFTVESRSGFGLLQKCKSLF